MNWISINKNLSGQKSKVHVAHSYCDDSRDDLLLAERTFRSKHFLNPVRLMNTGDECIRYFRNYTGENEPCLLFLDLSMRPTSGLEVLRAIHGTPIARRSIIIMLSGVTDSKLLREGYQSGARTFLLKPFTAESLIELLAAVKDKIELEHMHGGYGLVWAAPTFALVYEKLGI
jgi:CheY-like chemotaxis protein